MNSITLLLMSNCSVFICLIWQQRRQIKANLQSCRKVRLLLCWLFDTIHRHPWFEINFIKAASPTDIGHLPWLHSGSFLTSAHVTRMAETSREGGKPKRRENFFLPLLRLPHTGNGGKIGIAHGKLFPSAVIFFAGIWRTAKNSKRRFFEKFFHYLCFKRKRGYFAIIIKSCNDTGFHTPCVCANTTPLSI